MSQNFKPKFKVKKNRLERNSILSMLRKESTLGSTIVKTKWNSTLPIEVNIFAWRLALDRLPTRFNLDTRGIDLDSVRCAICDDAIETTQHFFVDCTISKSLWSMVTRWWGFDDHPMDVGNLIKWADMVCVLPLILMGDDGEKPAKERGDLSISYVPDDADEHELDMGFPIGSYVGSYVPDDADLHYKDMGFEVGSYVPDDADILVTDMGFEVGSYVPDDADLHFKDMGFEVGSYVPDDADSHFTDMGFEVGSYIPDDADSHFKDMGFTVGSHDADLHLDDLGFPIGSYTHEDMGFVLGGIKFVDRHLNVTDCTQFRVVNIPLDVDGITITNISAKFILLVEKIDLAKRLRASRFYSQFPCVIVATMGRAPDYCTRKFLYMLNNGEDLKLQLFALLDCIPHSIKTMHV
ncbi:hypothetical protein CTI12_AA095230 [Artemisia annua]|uniref:Uncharacterized protein n=1 Tax=Artemisia annua TaxID=35608 RepID=A0A2U1PZ13_ARTAN|nr:hypothetical protein CTI12_AA095230 [Artemisia annua]